MPKNIQEVSHFGLKLSFAGAKLMTGHTELRKLSRRRQFHIETSNLVGVSIISRPTKKSRNKPRKKTNKTYRQVPF